MTEVQRLTKIQCSSPAKRHAGHLTMLYIRSAPAAPHSQGSFRPPSDSPNQLPMRGNPLSPEAGRVYDRQLVYGARSVWERGVGTCGAMCGSAYLQLFAVGALNIATFGVMPRGRKLR